MICNDHKLYMPLHFFASATALAFWKSTKNTELNLTHIDVKFIDHSEPSARSVQPLHTASASMVAVSLRTLWPCIRLWLMTAAWSVSSSSCEI